MKLIYLLMMFMGPFLVGLNLATLYPSPDYNASWTSVGIAFGIWVWGLVGWRVRHF